MCELLGISARLPTRMTLSMSRLAARGDPARALGDGWGVALHDGADAMVVRRPEPAKQSAWMRAVESAHQPTALAIAHIRRATQGSVALRNTQPFCRELGGRLHVFAHNGNLPALLEQPGPTDARFQPIGDTDSEVAFCTLLERLASLWAGGPPSLAARRRVIGDFAAALRTLGPANFLYTDGDTLFAHADRRTQADGQIAPPGLVMVTRSCACDSEAEVAPVLHLSPTDTTQTVVILASAPLTEETWTPLPAGTLIAARAGAIITDH
ncbi:class II glutamine amidotransferase [Acidiphilium sp.]|uniref:class II glutamine amidotransferase n=1 Tax=Acidiphilium sp. TaxID=527 RepID=UPI003D03ED8E